MGKSLVVVESPAKAKTIGGFLGPSYRVVASMGHVRDLPVRALGVDTENGFKPEYETIRGKAGVVRTIRQAAKSSDNIYLAADQDREGEAIGWHVKSLLPRGHAPCRRVLFNEITKGAILQAMENPGLLDMNKVDAQQARRVLDRLVGYKVSPFLWRTLRTNLSAGRVQSVALRLVCEREAEIEAFVPQEYWVIKAHLANEDGNQFEAILAHKKGKKIRLRSADDAAKTYDDIARERFSVADLRTVAKTARTPAPHITSSLQQDASTRLGFSPDKTMKIAQQLYEGLDVKGQGHVGLITYMRTDSYRIAKTARDEVRRFIADRFGDDYVPSKPPFYGSRRRAQDAHEAIRPTGVFREPNELTGQLSKDQMRLYELIWSRFVASEMAPERVEVTTALIDAGSYTFRATGVRRLFRGHAAVWQTKREDQELPSLEKGQSLRLLRLEKKQEFTKPKPRFSEASLVKELEAKGIGRPSTYASVISTLRRRKYVSSKDKRLIPTELGKAVNSILVGRFPELFAVDFTAQLEDKLDMIERGQLSWIKVVDEFYQAFRKQLSEAERASSEVRRLVQRESGESCPVCDKPLFVKFGRHGEFLACSGFPSCRYTQPLNKRDEGPGQPRPETACPKCGASMVVRSGRFGEFLACSRYPECKTTLPITTGLTCPRDGCDGDIVVKRSRNGKRFYGCSRYPACDFVSWHEPVRGACPECDGDVAAKRKKGDGDVLVCLRCGHKYAGQKNVAQSGT
jgi:DNA topoisomerase-1